MRYGTMALAASALMFATAAASAGEGARVHDQEGATLIGARQSGMRMSGALMGAMKAAMARGDAAKTQGFGAGALAGWAKSLPAMFPKGSDGEHTDALPAVWSDWSGFTAASATFADAAGKLAAAAKADDSDAFKAALGEVGAACGACHDRYKKADEHH